MPVISMFYGVIILMYYFDNRKHHQPHIHVQYSDEEAVISIPEGSLMEGSLRRAKLKLVQAWIEIAQGVACSEDAEIESERENHLNQARACFTQLEDSAPEDIG